MLCNLHPSSRWRSYLLGTGPICCVGSYRMCEPFLSLPSEFRPSRVWEEVTRSQQVVLRIRTSYIIPTCLHSAHMTTPAGKACPCRDARRLGATSRHPAATFPPPTIRSSVCCLGNHVGLVVRLACLSHPSDGAEARLLPTRARRHATRWKSTPPPVILHSCWKVPTQVQMGPPCLLCSFFSAVAHHWRSRLQASRQGGAGLATPSERFNPPCCSRIGQNRKSCESQVTWRELATRPANVPTELVPACADAGCSRTRCA